MVLDKEKAILIDELLKASIEKHKNTFPNDPNFQLKEFTKNKSDNTPYSFEELQDAMSIAQQYKIRLKLTDAFSYDGLNGFSMTLEKLRPFLRTGGFYEIWEEEEKDRQFKDDVKTVNDSVRTTNKSVKSYLPYQLWASISAAVIAGLAAWISWLAYQEARASNETEQRLKTLEITTTKMQEQIQQDKQLTVTDTVHSIIVIDTLK